MSPVQQRHIAYNTDYISNLPDGVLTKILTLMSLKDAVRTCVLSKDWEYKWTSIYKLDIDVEDFNHYFIRVWTFVNIIERILHHMQSVTKFSLTCLCDINSELSRITSLVSAILRRNIKRLHLEIHNTQDFFLPRSLLNCTSLTRLILIFKTPCSLRVPAKICFPKLKSLTLERVMILNDVSNTDTLIFMFPVLTFLMLMGCKWVKVQFIEIHAPSLRDFTSMTPFEWEDKKDFDYTIKIFGTEIDELNASGRYPENISVIGSRVNSANVEYEFDHPLLSLQECGLQVRKLLRELPNLENLTIYDIRAIGQTKLGLPLLKFGALKKMCLFTPFDAEGLLELLHVAPLLKNLVLFLEWLEYEYDYDSVEPLPSCIVHHLEEIRFDYIGETPKSNFLAEKFLLKNGAQLKKVSVRGRYGVLENGMVEKLSTFTKASACLEIVPVLWPGKL